MEQMLTSIGDMVLNLGMMLAVIGVAQLALFVLVIWHLGKMKKKLDALQSKSGRAK
ncbi:hypothetical protein ES705_14614 [subsurface metagenome]